MEDPAFQEELHGAVQGGPPRPVNAFEPDFVAALELLPVVFQTSVERGLLGMPGTINAERGFHTSFCA
jgi:hypothetical protein